MATIYKVDCSTRKPIFIGVQEENESNFIQFDITPWVEKHGAGVATANAKAPNSTESYPVIVQRDGNIVTWKPKTADVAIEGVGAFQLIYTVGEVVARTRIWTTNIGPSLIGSGDPPDPIPDYIDEMREIAAETLTYSQNAANSADDAEAAAASVESVEDSLELVPDLSTLTWTIGEYYNYSTGETASNNSYARLLIPVKAFPIVTVTTMAANPAGIVLFDENGGYINGEMGTSSSLMQDYEIDLPKEAAFIGVSCVINKRDLVVVSAKINDQIFELYGSSISVPDTYIAIQNATHQGIKNKDGSVYNPTTNYEGRYATGHFSAGDKIRFTGYSVNSNYPALVVKFDDNTTYYNYTNISAQYKDILYTMPKDGNVFVNGNASVLLPVIEKLQEGLSGSYSKMLLSEYLTAGSKLKAKVNTTGQLFVKKRISSTLSVAVVFAHVGGNSLFGFSGIRLVDEVSGEPTNDNFASNGTSINAATTDWFAPYYVQAVNNADGDVPEGNAYFTGGNHRSNNTSSGGGITAEEESIAFLFGGVTPLTDVVYNVGEIDVKWTNAVQGNNTSKADGTGRAILEENWHMIITPEKIECENDIVPLEDIKLKTYYGLQMYFPSSQVIFKGGATRTPFAISTATTSGNKTCRSALAYNSNFSIEMAVEPLDLGLFEHSNYSMFTTNVSKLYAYLVGSEITCHENEHYYVKGYYKPW